MLWVIVGKGKFPIFNLLREQEPVERDSMTLTNVTINLDLRLQFVVDQNREL